MYRCQSWAASLKGPLSNAGFAGPISPQLLNLGVLTEEIPQVTGVHDFSFIGHGLYGTNS